MLNGTAILTGVTSDGAIQNLAPQLIFEQIPLSRRPVDSASRAAEKCDLETQLGSRIVLLNRSKPEQEMIVLTPDFAAAGRPDLSFDARRILFVGKRRLSDALGVWEMKIDDREVRQIIQFSTDCTDARYLSTIYSLEAERPEYQLCFCRPDESGISAAFTCRMDGSGVRRITFDPYGVRDPLPLSDSRILLSFLGPDSESRTIGKKLHRDPVLCTINTDGTDVGAFGSAQGPAATRRTPCEMSDGRVVFVESGLGQSGRGAALIAVSRTKGFRSQHVLVSDPDGAYVSPSPLTDDCLLVSYRPKNTPSYGVYLVEPSRGARVDLVYDSPQWHDVRAIAVRPRPEPAGRSSQVDDRADSGYLYALSCYLSDTPEGKRIRAGDIRQVEVFKAVTLKVDDAAGTGIAAQHSAGAVKEESLGKAPVEVDGSLFIKVPARTALRLQTLDADGRVQQAMQSWFWVMPKEGRGCIGCHEDRELTPPNRHVLALRRPPNAVGVAPDADVETERMPVSETGYRR